jgi:hypothetical protein
MVVAQGYGRKSLMGSVPGQIDPYKWLASR